MPKPLSINPELCFNLVEGWNDPVGEAFSSVSEAAGYMRDLQLGGDGFSGAAVGFASGVRSVKATVQSVARASTSADLGGMSAYALVQASITGALLKQNLTDAEQAELVEQAEEYASKFPEPVEDFRDGRNEIPSAEEVQEVADFLEANRDNEEVLEAFYAKVPPENLLAYVSNLRYIDGDNDEVAKAQHDVMVQLGDSLGKASSTGLLPPRYAEGLVAAVQRGVDDRDGRQMSGWALAEVLENGQYGEDFLVTLGEGVLAIEAKKTEGRTGAESFWTGRSPDAVLGYERVADKDPVSAALNAMMRRPDNGALDRFLYPENGDVAERHDQLVRRAPWEGDALHYSAQLTGAFERLAIPAPDADNAEMNRAAMAATDAVRILPPMFQYDDPKATTAARSSMANILTFYWPDVDAVVGTSDPDYVSPGVEELRWSTGRVEFTRDEVEAALGMTMDLDDFDADSSAIGTSPSARVMTAAANFNDFRTQLALGNSAADPISSDTPTYGTLNSSFKLNVDRLGFVTQAGFQDELDDAGDRDARLGVFRSFTIKAISTAAGLGASSAATAAGGPVAGKVANSAASWGTNRALESWVPEPGAADSVNGSIADVGAGLIEAEKVRWASEVWDADLPDDLDFKRGNVPKSPDELEGQDRVTEADQVLKALGLATEALPTFNDGRDRAAED